jgi:hypothetical protein
MALTAQMALARVPALVVAVGRLTARRRKPVTEAQAASPAAALAVAARG